MNKELQLLDNLSFSNSNILFLEELTSKISIDTSINKILTGIKQALGGIRQHEHLFTNFEESLHK